MYKEPNIVPINYQLYMQANNIFENITALHSPRFIHIVDNYEIQKKKHSWFKKSKITLDRGPPDKKCTT